MFVTSAVYRRKRMGPRTLPWGTPQVTTDSVDTSPAKLTVCKRFVMNDWIQSMTDPRIANADCKRSSRIWWPTVSKPADTDRSSNVNQLRFLVVGKCSAKRVQATKQLCCWSFDNVLTQSGIRNIERCCSCSYGHWTFFLLQSLLSLQLVLLIHSNSLFLCVFCTCKPSTQFTMRHFMCKRHWVRCLFDPFSISDFGGKLP